MPTVYLNKEQYDEIVRRGDDVAGFIRDAVKVALEKAKKGAK